MKRVLKGAVLLLVTTLVVSCNETTENWIAKVNDSLITEDHVRTGLFYLPESVRQQVPAAQQPTFVLNQLVQNEVFYQEALLNNVAAQQEYQNYIKRITDQYEYQKKQGLVDLYLREVVDSKVSVTEQEIAAAYDVNKNTLFSQFEQRSISQIVVKTKEEANAIVASLKKGADFSSLARTKSIDVNTGQNGGKIQGYFRASEAPNEFERVVFGLKRTGAVGTPIQTQAGFHIVRLDDVQTVPARSFDQVKTLIRNELYVKKRNAQINNVLASIKDKYTISQNPALNAAAQSNTAAAAGN